MKCKVCGGDVYMYVKIELNLPVKYESRLSKKVINKKECQITAAFWDTVRYRCNQCNKRYEVIE